MHWPKVMSVEVAPRRNRGLFHDDETRTRLEIDCSCGKTFATKAEWWAHVIEATGGDS